MSEPEAPPPQVPRQVTPLGPGFWRGAWQFMVRGWRPFGGWVCALILLARGVVIPITQLVRGDPVEPLDWVALTALIGILGLGGFRSKERLAGVAG